MASIQNGLNGELAVKHVEEATWKETGRVLGHFMGVAIVRALILSLHIVTPQTVQVYYISCKGYLPTCKICCHKLI